MITLKNRIVKLATSILVALLLLASQSCSFNAVRKVGAIAADWGNGNGSKTVYPFDPALANIDHYDIVFTGPENQVEELAGVKGTSAEMPRLPIGQWTIEVIAYNGSSQVLGRGIASAEVKPSSTTKVIIKVQPSGEGTLEFTVSWEGNAEVAETMTVAAAILPDGQTDYIPVALSKEGTKALYSAKLGAGTYNVLLKLIDDNSKVLWGKLETFQLYEDLATKANFNIVPSEMNGKPEKAPTLTSADRSYDKIRLAWDEGSSRAERYVLQRKTFETEWCDIATLQYMTLAYTDTERSSATKYSYRIRAENYYGESVWSPELEISTIPLEHVGSLLMKSAVWTNDRIYKVESNLKIPSGLTLKIMPGVKVIVDSGKFIQVEGELIAKGEVDAPIVIGYESSGWTYLGFVDKATDAEYVNGHYASGSVLQHVMIRGGGRIGVDKAYPYLDSLDIENASGNSVSLTLDGDMSKTLSLTNSSIRNAADSGVYINGNGVFKIESNYITSTNIGIRVEGGAHPGASISANRIIAGYQGIILNEVQENSNSIFLISHNFLAGISRGSDIGIRIQTGYPTSNIEFIDNTISSVDYGIYLWYCGSWLGVEFIDNNISDCRQGISIYDGGWGTNPIKFNGNTIRDCTNYGMQYDNPVPGKYLFSGNYFDNKNAAYEVLLGNQQKLNGALTLDLSNNYWNTNDPVAIKSRIFDAEKDFERGLVNVEPVAVLNGLIARPSSPANNAVLTSSATDLRWTMVGRASSTCLQIAKDNAFANILEDRLVNASSWTLGADGSKAWIKDAATYYWRIAGKAADGTVYSWSEPRSFRLSIPVPAPATPVNGETLYDDMSPLVSWVPSVGAEAYRLIVDNGPDLVNPIVDVRINSGSSYEFAQDLAPGTTYYWQVSAIDENGVESIPSAVQTFILPQPGILVRLSPDLPLPQEMKISGADTAVQNTAASFSCTSRDAMERYVWTLNGEQVAETYVPNVSVNIGARAAGFYTFGVTGWKSGYSYNDAKAFRIVKAVGAP